MRQVGLSSSTSGGIFGCFAEYFFGMFFFFFSSPLSFQWVCRKLWMDGVVPFPSCGGQNAFLGVGREEGRGK